MEFFQHEVDLAGGIKPLDCELIGVAWTREDLAKASVEVSSIKATLDAHLYHEAGCWLKPKPDLAPAASIDRQSLKLVIRLIQNLGIGTVEEI